MDEKKKPRLSFFQNGQKHTNNRASFQLDNWTGNCWELNRTQNRTPNVQWASRWLYKSWRLYLCRKLANLVSYSLIGCSTSNYFILLSIARNATYVFRIGRNESCNSLTNIIACICKLHTILSQYRWKPLMYCILVHLTTQLFTTQVRCSHRPCMEKSVGVRNVRVP